MGQDICIRIVIESSKLLTSQEIPVCLKSMPNLRLTDGDAVVEDTLSKWIDGYGDWLAAKENDPKYISNTTRMCKKVCKDLNWRQPGDINDTQMIEFLAGLKQQRRGGKTRNHYRDAVCGLCSWLVRKEILSVNPIELVPKAKITDQVPYAVPTERHVSALIEAAKADGRKKDRWIVYMLAASTGLRKHEIECLTVGMYRGGDSPHFALPASVTKSRKPQVVMLTDAMNRVILEHIKGRGLDDAVVVAIPKWESFERDRKKAGIPKVDNTGSRFSFHSLRHYYCNKLADNNVDSETRRKLMRHGSLSMTEGVYTRTNAERLSKKINETSFFAVDSDDEEPIDWRDTKGAAMTQAMTLADFGGSGSNPVIPISRADNPRNEHPVPTLGGVDEHTPQQDSPRCDAGGGNDQTLHGGGSLSTPANAERQSSRAHNALSALPGSVSPGRAAEGHLNNQPRYTARDLSEAYLEGLRDGRREINGDTE